MSVNDLLEEKWKTQRKMAAKANYSIKKMLDNAEKIVEEMIKEHGVSLKYANRKPSLNLKK
ncbi:MAG: hypothetical protein PVH61_19165 [Candidatus Aminicenantes bacterium]|jgi:hypothetical protein